MQSRLRRDRAVEAVGDGRYRAVIDRGWWIHRGPNWGYVAAVLVRALEAGGFIEEDGEVWSRDGVLLAQSRQLAVMMPLPA